MFLYKFFLNIYNIHKLVISRTPLYGYLIIYTDSLPCPWKKKALTFSLNSTRLIRTPVNTDNGHFNFLPNQQIFTESGHYQHSVQFCNRSFLKPPVDSMRMFPTLQYTVQDELSISDLFWYQTIHKENGFDKV